MQRIQKLTLSIIFLFALSVVTTLVSPTATKAIDSSTVLCKENPKKGVKNTNACKKGYAGAIGDKSKVDTCKSYKSGSDERKSCEWGYDKTKAAIKEENENQTAAERGKSGADDKLSKGNSCAGLSGTKRKTCEKAWVSQVKKLGAAKGVELASGGAENDSGCDSLGFGGTDAKKACKDAFKKDKSKTGNARYSCGNTGTFFNFEDICSGTDDEKGGTENPIFAMLLGIVNIVAFGVGIAVVGGIVYGGLMYSTARDNSGQVQKAINIIATSVVGLIAYALLWAVINFIVPGGLIAG